MMTVLIKFNFKHYFLEIAVIFGMNIFLLVGFLNFDFQIKNGNQRTLAHFGAFGKAHQFGDFGGKNFVCW